MSYEVLARKWRPRTFGQLVGQVHAIKPLVHALENNRLHHAFLFTGTRGVGKTTIARILAKSLNCEKGVTAQPCGECSSCTEVDEGRFVDLIEVDAASRTKVDDTRELLENVQYAPTRGRFKVYLIDEVHMLSTSSFNALLKTLEEPPPHVKFLLATTDPQKLPVTVLSRCLQFALKRLSMEQIAGQLKFILEEENIDHDAASLILLARAADGSMRDALSLLDQAIAYGGGHITESLVREVLGTINQHTVVDVLQALSRRDGDLLMRAINEAIETGADHQNVLDGLMSVLHRISMAQIDINLLAGIEDEESNTASQLKDLFSPEEVQLYYQIALHGKRDLHFAPDPRTGLEMTLLRMLAFQPADMSSDVLTTEDVSGSKGGARAPYQEKTQGEITPPVEAMKADAMTITRPEPNTVAAETSWAELIEKLPVTGVLRQLAMHMALESRDGGKWRFILDENAVQLCSKNREKELKNAVEELIGESITLIIEPGKSISESPAAKQSRENNEMQQRAEESIMNDPNISKLQKSFNARVNPGSIRPR